MKFRKARPWSGTTTIIECSNGHKKFVLGECTGTDELRRPTLIHQPAHSSYVIVVPVSCDHQDHGACWIDSHIGQIAQRLRVTRFVFAGIYHDPLALANVKNDGLAIPRTDQRNLYYVEWWWHSIGRHRPSKRRVSVAHSDASSRSALVTTGKSRKTIWETLRFVPPSVCSYPMLQRKMLPRRIVSLSRSAISTNGIVASSSSRLAPPVRSHRRATKSSSRTSMTYPSHSWSATNPTGRDEVCGSSRIGSRTGSVSWGVAVAIEPVLPAAASALWVKRLESGSQPTDSFIAALVPASRSSDVKSVRIWTGLAVMLTRPWWPTTSRGRQFHR